LSLVLARCGAVENKAGVEILFGIYMVILKDTIRKRKRR
jgi:hypothetical protein